MKYIITEDQLKKVKDRLLKIPFSTFGYDWHSLQEYLKGKGNPPYILKGSIDLMDYKEITTLGSLISVEGNIYLLDSSIKTLENLTSVEGSLNLMYSSIQSLGNLISVGGGLDLSETPIKSLGNLKSVGNSLYLKNTQISKIYTEKQIRDIVDVGGEIHL
jgi:hypothetical protein